MTEMPTLAHRVPRWTVAELTLTGARRYANPYADVEVTATFTGPDGRVIARPACWDGGDRWLVRFAPTAAGRWRWRTVCSEPADAGLHGREGELTCVPYRGAHPVYRHGFLRVDAGGRHFVHADGAPFFWLGDTHWQLPDTERIDACNHPEHGGAPCPHGGQFQHLAADRAARGFTVYQTYPAAVAPHWWAEPFTRIDPRRFRQVFDVEMDHLAARGFVVALGCGHYHNATVVPAADLRRFARYLVARYGAHPVVWITGQEMNAPEEDRHGRPFNRMAVWLGVAEEIARADGYRHPHSAHQWVVDVETRPLGGEAWHQWFALQGGHGRSRLTPQRRYRDYYGYEPVRPILETEAMYELVDCGGVNSTDDARASAWKAMLCGCAGYTYGAAGVWALKWEAADTRWAGYNHQIEAWHAGMALPGAAQMTAFKAFFAALPWTAFTPRFDDPAWSWWEDAERCVLASDGTRRYLAYLYGDTARGELRGLERTARYAARWINPRDGTPRPLADGITAPAGVWPVPEKPAGDWALLLERTEA